MLNKISVKEIIALFREISIFETVFTTVVASTFGALFWGWTFVYDILKPYFGGFSDEYERLKNTL
jgi:hypothetical protein